MFPLISVVVPVYNSERYLHRCVDSIVSQTYPNVEILLIDDGSSDASPSICDAYAICNSRIKVLHKENGGVSTARNAGIDRAVGKYICFVDSDDFLPSDALAIFHKAVMCTDADLCVGAISGWETYVTSYELVSLQDAPRKVLELLVRNNSYSSLAKLFRMDILNQHGIRFNEKQTCSEDTIFNREYIAVIDRIVTIPDMVYVCDPSNPYSLSKRGHVCYAEYRINKLKSLEKICDRLAIDDTLKKQFLLL